MFKDFFGLLFPVRCPGCGQNLVRQEGAVCMECLTEIRPTGFHRKPSENELYYRIAGKVSLESGLAMYYFDKHGRMKRIIQALKYKNQPQVGEYLGEVYGEQLCGLPALADVSCLVPVPLHRKRLAERGYNQAEAIAKGLAKATKIPIKPKGMKRVDASRSQTQKGKNERWENVKNVFQVNEDLSGHVLLVDDVVTTGSTLEACIRALMAQNEPPEKVSIVAIAITVKG